MDSPDASATLSVFSPGSADAKTARRRRSDRFLRVVSEFDSAIIVTHDNPDPDAIASGWGLFLLIRDKLHKPVRLVAGGAIIRAENLRMVELLKPPIELIDRIEPQVRCAAVLVDCQPMGVNHLLTSSRLQPAVVIDHHQPAAASDTRVSAGGQAARAAAAGKNAQTPTGGQDARASTDGPDVRPPAGAEEVRAPAAAKNAQPPLGARNGRPPMRAAVRPRFSDIRPKVTATATIVAQYLREQDIDPRPELATALVYALRTDMQAAQTTFCPADQHAFEWLMHRVDHAVLNEIENAPLPPAYYADLLLALQNTFTYNDAALCFLPRASGPEIIAEVADLLIRRQDIHRVLCGAVVGGSVLLSVRTSADNGDATSLLQRTLDGLGYGGGHRHRAGGKVDLASHADAISEDLQSVLRSRWLDACGIDQQRGSRLVPRSEILENL
jgi:nanoRNase/pAp phosphatase (c-di-AMP/oligoRNAs hydrolase)